MKSVAPRGSKRVGHIAHCESAEGLSGSGAPRLRSSRKSIRPTRSEAERGEPYVETSESCEAGDRDNATDQDLIFRKSKVLLRRSLTVGLTSLTPASQASGFSLYVSPRSASLRVGLILFRLLAASASTLSNRFTLCGRLPMQLTSPEFRVRLA